MTQKRRAYVWILLSILFVGDSSYAYQINGIEEFLSKEKKEQVQNIFAGFDDRCKDIQETDYPTIFIPGILASWYSSYGHGETKVKRWIPDPITHVYDTLFYTFMQNGYSLEDVFYDDEFNVYIEGNPKGALYLFGYDWKKDNTVTATLLTQLIGKILEEYKKQNGCDIGKVNIIAHSMGGLVARSMLEDMCVYSETQGNKFIIPNFYTYDKDGKITNVNGEIIPPKSSLCTNPINPYKDIKIHKLITIATPHRGSPKAFPLWEKGDITMTDGFAFGQVLKLQFFDVTNESFYQTIHGFSLDVPNGAVSVGQLLPDISKANPYNSKLQYLKKKNTLINYNNYPKNSFLEALNSQENIGKMWNKIDAYISYYSTVTSNNDTNNIVSFTLPEKILVGVDESIDGVDKGVYETEITETLSGKNIYDAYPKWTNMKAYHMAWTEQNDIGLGGDGTVPTYNLRLVPNDVTDNKEVVHQKFQSREIKCYWDIHELYKDGNEAKEYRGFGEKDRYEVCTHTNMPIATALRVFEDISGKKIDTPRAKLLSYIGRAEYTFGSLALSYGIQNSLDIEKAFDIFIRSVSNEKIEKDTDNPIRFSLDVSGGFTEKISGVVAYEVLSPINLLITDEQGRRIGIDPATGMIINEIPGAWTSGDTQGSNEPEVFFIPVEEGESLTHTIQSFGTGDGGYHIQATQIDMQTDTPDTQLFTIAGEAKQAFVETYQVQTNQQGASYSKQKTQLEIQTDKNSYTSYSSDFSVRYFVSTDRVLQKAQLGYTLYDTNKKQISKNIQDIKGLIDLKLPKYGNYILELSLLDGGKVLLKKHIDIHYTQQSASHIFLDLGIGRK